MLLGQWTSAEEAPGADESERRCDAHNLYARAGQRKDDEAARQADSRGDGAPAHRHPAPQHRAAVRTAGDDTRGGVGREQVDGSALGLPALARGEDEGACQGPGRDGPQRRPLLRGPRPRRGREYSNGRPTVGCCRADGSTVAANRWRRTSASRSRPGFATGGWRNATSNISSPRCSSEKPATTSCGRRRTRSRCPSRSSSTRSLLRSRSTRPESPRLLITSSTLASATAVRGLGACLSLAH